MIFLSRPPPLGKNTPSAHVTAAFHEAYVGVVVMNQLNYHAILGFFSVWGEHTFGENHELANVLSLLQSSPPS